MAPPSIQKLKQTAEILEKEGRIRELIGVMQQLSALLPNSVSIHLKLAELFIQVNALRWAEKSFRRVLQITKKPDPKICKWLGTRLLQTLRYDEAPKYLDIAEAANPADVEARILAAEARYMCGDNASAIHKLEATCAEFPEVAIAAYSLALYYFDQRRFNEALAFARKAIDLGEQTSSAHVLLGRACLAVGNINEAHRSFRNAISASDSTASTFIAEQWLGELIDRLGLAEAIDCYRREAWPMDATDCVHLAELLLRDGQSSAAAEIIKEQIALHPDSPILMGTSARILALDGDWQNAYKVAESLWSYAASNSTSGKKKAMPSSKAPGPREVSRLIYVAVEISSREFESRLLVAARAAEHNIYSVVASSHLLANAMPNLPAGICLLKTMNYYDSLRVRSSRAQNTGHQFIALDEEQLSSNGNNWELSVGVDPNIVNGVDLILANNDKHRIALESEFPSLQGKVVTTGNPRIELLRQEFAGAFAQEAETIRSKYKKIVLVCTNFGGFASSNHSYAEICRIMFEALNRPLDTEEGQAIVQMGKDFALSEARSMAAMLDFVPTLAQRFPDVTIVIRPHPAETKAVWVNKFAPYSNVVVGPEGSLQAWLRASDAMIYFAGCMTGVEAKLCSIPAIRFEADPELKFPKSGLSSCINPPARNSKDLIRLIDQVLSENAQIDYDFDADNRLLEEQFLVPAPLPSERCANAIGAYCDRIEAAPITDELVANVGRAFQNSERREHLSILGGNKNIASKRLTTDVEEVRLKIADLQKAMGSTTEMSVIKLADGAMMIGPAKLR